MTGLRNEIAEIIGIKENNTLSKIEYRIIESTKENGYNRQLIKIGSNDSCIIAYLLIPEVVNKNPAILINHQHNREHHFGKSEVCGLVGNPLQAFAPILVKKGFVVLVPDSICFEERRKNGQGTIPSPNDDDFILEQAQQTYREHHAEINLYHKRYLGEHALTEERVNFIIKWIIESCAIYNKYSLIHSSKYDMS